MHVIGTEISEHIAPEGLEKSEERRVVEAKASVLVSLVIGQIVHDHFPLMVEVNIVAVDGHQQELQAHPQEEQLYTSQHCDCFSCIAF